LSDQERKLLQDAGCRPKNLRDLGDVCRPATRLRFGYRCGTKDVKRKKKLTEASMADKQPVVLLSTNKGDIRIELDTDKAPITTQNFIDYVNDRHYDGLIFHRVIPGFMIQGGGMDAQMAERKTKAPIKNEAANGLKNDTGSIAMARTNVVDSATSQFFINVKDNDFLNHRSTAASEFGYTVFGRVIEGMEIVREIEKAKTQSRGHHDDVPVEPVVIQAARVEP
jgi:peptidyl-prolyl cis-trans isomerase B (cyclophilin B)